MKVTEGISFAIPSDRAIEFLERTEKAQKGEEKRIQYAHTFYKKF